MTETVGNCTLVKKPWVHVLEGYAIIVLGNRIYREVILGQGGVGKSGAHFNTYLYTVVV